MEIRIKLDAPRGALRRILLYVVLPILGLAAAAKIAQATVDTTWIAEGQPVSATKLAAGLKDLDGRLTTLESGGGAGGSLPPGTIVAYGGNAAPPGWTLCDGSPLTRAEDPALFAAIGTSFGAPDASRFNVPDLRGRFIRGADRGAGNDPGAKDRIAVLAGGAAGDAVGSLQDDSLASHTHAFNSELTYPAGTRSGPGATSNGNGSVGTRVTDATGGAETRPRNVSVAFIIKR